VADPRRLDPGQRQYRGNTPIDNGLYITSDVAAYGRDLVDYAHKHKFLFLVSFTFAPGYEYLGGASHPRFALLVQTTTRPSPKFEYDNINLYGVRTQVLTKTTFSPMSMTFLDDQQNEMMRFLIATLRVMSPITNMVNDVQLETNQYDFRLNQGKTDDITNASPLFGPHMYPVSSGPMGGRGAPGEVAPIREINLFHVFGYGDQFNQYKFLMPRITNLKLDDLDMSSSEKTLITVDFEYASFTASLNQRMTPEVGRLVGPVIYPMRRYATQSA
jgi:hypothetical protein